MIGQNAKYLTLAFALSILSLQSAFARQADAIQDWACWYQAGQVYRVSPVLLYTIAMVESGNNPRAINKNKNGTEDIGLMQINSSHLSWLEKYGITREMLLEDPCLNVHVGAYILAENISRYGYSWEAVGAYNAKSPEKRARYTKKVWNMYLKLISGNN